MSKDTLSVRELQEDDIELITNYWLNADAAALAAMGADINKLPARDEWHNMLLQQIGQSYAEKKSYAIIWLVNGTPAGHCNINKIIMGTEAYMHLHMWHAPLRRSRLGAELVKLSLPYFFNNMQLNMLFCEPYALNPAPNKTLEKTGFTLKTTYTGTPGWINLEQEVNVWEMSYDTFRQLHDQPLARR